MVLYRGQLQLHAAPLHTGQTGCSPRIRQQVNHSGSFTGSWNSSCAGLLSPLFSTSRRRLFIQQHPGEGIALGGELQFLHRRRSVRGAPLQSAQRGIHAGDRMVGGSMVPEVGKLQTGTQRPVASTLFCPQCQILSHNRWTEICPKAADIRIAMRIGCAPGCAACWAAAPHRGCPPRTDTAGYRSTGPADAHAGRFPATVVESLWPLQAFVQLVVGHRVQHLRGFAQRL